MTKNTTITNDEREYLELCARVRAADVRPQHLLFWLEHAPQRSAQLVWRDCMRADWLLWIAELYGLSRSVVCRVRTLVTRDVDAQRERMVQCC